MIPVQTALVNSAIRTQVDLERFSVGVTEKVEDLLSKAQTEILKALLETDPTARPLTEWKQRRLAELNDQINGILQSYYTKIDKDVTKSLVGIAAHQMDATTGTVRNVFGANLFSVTLTEENLKAIVSNTLIDGATIKQWWEGKPEAYRQKFQRAMQAGMQQIELGQVKGESIGELIRRIRGTKDTPGVMDVAKHEAAALVRTSVMQVAQGVRREIYAANADVIKGLQVVATLDMRTTPLCRALDGTQYDLDGNPLDGGNRPMPPGPPFHWNCRSTLVPIFKPYSELIKTKGKLSGEKLDELEKVPLSTRASMRGQVPDSMDYNAWLKTQPEQIQKEVLGEARWELWNTGKLTMADMVHQNGRPLTLPELERKVALYDERKAAEIARREAEAQIKTLEDQWAARMKAPGEVVTFTKGESLPETMFPYATSVDMTAYRKEVSELPALAAEAGKKRAAGIIMVEDDGKVWIVRPTGKYGGIEATFPKGRFSGEILEGALRETWEETGFQAEITGFLGDYSRRATKTRYYIGRRIGGSPMAMGSESEAVVLGPVDKIRAILNMDVDKAIADDLANHIKQATAAGEGDLHKGFQRLVKDATYKSKFDDLMASPEVLFDLKLSPEQIPVEMTWENKYLMVKARLDAMAQGKIDVWLTRAGSAEYDILSATKMEGREAIDVFKEVSKKADDARKAAESWLKSAPAGSVKEAAMMRMPVEGMDPYVAQKEIQKQIKIINKEAFAEFEKISKGAPSIDKRALQIVMRGGMTAEMDDFEVLRAIREKAKEIQAAAEKYFFDTRRLYGDERFLELQNELAKIRPEYHTLDLYTQMELFEDNFRKLLSDITSLEELLDSSSKIRTLYIERVDLTLPVEKRLELLIKEKDAFKDWATTPPHPDSVPTAGKLMKDYTASEAASIYGTLRKALIAGKLPKSTTAIMRRWEELAVAERKRVIDMWLGKGMTIPEDFLKKYYITEAAAAAPAAPAATAAAKGAETAAAYRVPEIKNIAQAKDVFRTEYGIGDVSGGLNKVRIANDELARLKALYPGDELADGLSIRDFGFRQLTIIDDDIIRTTGLPTKGTFFEGKVILAGGKTTGESTLTLGRKYVTADGDLRGELRRRLADVFMEGNESAKWAWKDIWRGETKGTWLAISERAGAYSQEGFREAFTVYTSPFYEKGMLPAKVEDFMKTYLGERKTPGVPDSATPKTVKSTGGKLQTYRLEEYREYAPKEGSNPGGFFHNKANPADRFYFKFPDDEMKVYNEILASRLYRAAGVEVPELGIVEGAGGKKGVASRIIDGVEKSEDKLVSGKVTGIKENFVVDAWLANWDVVGGAYDNLVIQGGTKAVRIDVGGSLLYRARGGLKGAAFGTDVGELHTLLDAGRNPQSARIFGGITQAELKAGAAKVTRLTDVDIAKIVDEVIPKNRASERQLLKDTLAARRDYIKEHFAEAPIMKSAAPPPVVPLHDLQVKTIDVAIRRGRMTETERRGIISSFKQKEGLQLTESQVQKIEQKFAEQMRVCTNIPIEDGPTSDVYKNLMKDPELKNQFVRGRNGGSRGAHGPYKGSSRDSWERTLSDGILQTDPAYQKMKSRYYFETADRLEAARRRPYYGFVWDNSYIYGDNPASQYGDLTCVLKKYKREQSTFTIGNSSGLSGSESYKHGAAKAAKPILSRTMAGSNNRWTKGEVQAILDGTKTVNQVGYKQGSYVEAQIYGTLRLDRDVEYMIWHGDTIPDYVKKFADRYGVPVYKVNDFKKMLAKGQID